MSEIQVPTDGTLYLDLRLQSYEGFFNHDWAAKLFDLSDGTKIGRLSFALCTDWKSISNTFRFPWLLVSTLKWFHDGYSKHNEPFLLKLTEGLRDRVLKHKDIPLSTNKRRAVSKHVDHLSLEMRETLKHNPSKLEAPQIWDQYIRNPEFAISVWGSLRVCYSAVFHSYENFLTRCAGLAKGDDAYRAKRIRDLRDNLNNLLGCDAGTACLGGTDLEVARVTRNALAHNGGNMTPELAVLPHHLKIIDGKIHILPDDVRGLFNLLSGKVMWLAERCKALPAFQSPKGVA